MKIRMILENMAGRVSGKVTERRVLQMFAPEMAEASSRAGSIDLNEEETKIKKYVPD